MENKPSYTLGKTERLKSRKLIEQLFSDGKSFSIFPFRVLWMPGDNKTARLQAGFTVSTRRFKKSVDRNRIKRLMREAWRLQKHELQDALETKELALAVFMIYTGNDLPEYQAIKEKTAVALQRLIKLVNEKGLADT